jgi:hypothetical protein
MQPASRAARWGPRIVVVLFLAIFLPIGVSLLYTYSPTEYSFLPCIFQQLTGYHCPGCGATRCCHSLLHGDIEQALAWNPLFVVLLPAMLYVAGRTAYQIWTGNRRAGYWFPLWTTHLLMWLMLAYWIARNLPFEPFTYLAPHDVSSSER